MKPIRIIMAAMAAAALTAGAEPQVPVIVQARSLSRLSSDLALYAQSMALTAPVDGWVNGLVARCGAADLAGIDTNRGCALCVVMPEAGPAAGLPGAPAIVLAMPLADDGALYLKGLAGSYAETGTVNGVRHFVRTTGAGPAGADLFVKLAGKVAVAGPTAEAVRAVADRIAAGTLRAGSAAVAGTVKLHLDVPALMPLMESAMALAATQAQNVGGAAAGPGGAPVDAAKMMEIYREYALGILRQIKGLTLAGSVKAGGVELVTGLAPVPGTTVDKLCRGLKPVSARYAGLLPPDALFAEAGNGLNLFDELIEPYCDFLGRVYGAMGATGMVSRLTPLLMNVKGLNAGEYAMGVVRSADGQRLGLVQVTAQTDPARTLAVNAQMMAAYGETFGAMSPGVTIVTNAPRKHGDVEVQAFTYRLDPAAMARPPTAQPVAWPAWLTTLRAESAVVGHDAVMVLGGSDIMDAMIDRLKAADAGGAAPALVAEMFPKTAGEPVSLASVHVVNLLRALLGLLPNANPALAAAIPESRSGMAGYTYVAGDEVVSVARMSLTEMAAVKNAVPVLIGAMTQAMLSGAPAAAQAVDPRAACVGNLRLIEAAKKQLAAERKLKAGDPVDAAALAGYLKGGALPTCPGGGRYEVKAIGAEPTCSALGHTLSWDAGE
jgi:hypothetical protein